MINLNMNEVFVSNHDHTSTGIDVVLIFFRCNCSDN